MADNQPTAGAKTVTTTAAEIFAGVSKLTNRTRMLVYNESAYTVYFGDSSVTTSSGMPILPGDYAEFDFRKNRTLDTVYMIAAASAAVRVVEEV